MLDQGTLLSQRYRIGGVLGQGGMGAVYLADAEALGGKKVAVKEMVPWGLPPGELEQAVTQFKKEAAFLAGLEHPNVVRVTDFFVEDGKHYLVMDYIHGETLQEKMTGRGRPFHWYELCGWVESLMDVLEYLHSQSPPIIFRDLKPSNIMVSSDDRLNLIDFGIARSACQGEKTTTFLRGTGTRGFSPIEQYGNQQSTDQRSDIYALGATLYYLMTASLPPDAVERVSRRAAVAPLSQRCPDSPPELDFIIDKAMALAAEDRYQSVAEMRVALYPGPRPLMSPTETPFSVENGTALPSVVIRSHRREGSSWRGWVSAAGCLLVTGALLMSFSLHSQAADLHDVAIEVGNPSAGLAATLNSPPKKQGELSQKPPSPKLSALDSEPLPATQQKKLAASEPPVQKAAVKRSVNATLALDAYPKARVSSIAPTTKQEKETISVEEPPLLASLDVVDQPVKKVQEEEPAPPTGPEQTGPSEPVVQAPIYVMPPEDSQVGTQSGSSVSTVYQTSTQWASRGQTVDPTQVAPPGGPSLTNVPVTTSLPPGLADNGPANVALSTAPVEASKKGGKGKSGSTESKSAASPSKSQGKKNESKAVASNSGPGGGGGEVSGSKPKPKGDKGGAKEGAGTPPPPPQRKPNRR